MKITSFEEFKELARRGTFVPVVKEMVADLLTPVSAFLKIAEDADYAFLLEKWGQRKGSCGEISRRKSLLSSSTCHVLLALEGEVGRTEKDVNVGWIDELPQRADYVQLGGSGPDPIQEASHHGSFTVFKTGGNLGENDVSVGEMSETVLDIAPEALLSLKSSGMKLGYTAHRDKGDQNVVVQIILRIDLGEIDQPTPAPRGGKLSAGGNDQSLTLQFRSTLKEVRNDQAILLGYGLSEKLLTITFVGNLLSQGSCDRQLVDHLPKPLNATRC